MRLGRWLRSWVRTLFRRSRLDREMDSELRFHVEAYAEDLVRSGVARDEALRRARIEFGGLEGVKEECRDARGISFMESLWQDLRFGVRMLRKSPGFAAVAILTLALGIGANTAIFSAVNAILIEPLPYADSGRLIQIYDGGHSSLSLPDIRDIQSECPVLRESAAYSLSYGATMLGAGFPDQVKAPLVAGNFFAVLGVRPLLGRPILPSDTQVGSDRVAVLGQELWKADFGGDDKVLGKTIMLDDGSGKTPYTIIGVMPPGFDMGLNGGRGLWRPLVRGAGASARRGGGYYLVGRLRSGATIGAAQVQLKTISARLAALYPATDKGLRLDALSAQDDAIDPWNRGTLPRELLILSMAVGLVLLIACVNLSGMLLARSRTRHREVAIRAALGATRRRIVWQFLVESLLLSLAGGAVGLLLAVWLVPGLRAIAPAGTPRLDNLGLNANVLGFAVGLSILTGILFGLVPAWKVSGQGVGATLKEGIGGLLEGFSARGPRRLRGALVIVEIALAVVLATGATLVVRTLINLMGVRLGYRTENVLAVQPTLSVCAYPYIDQDPAPCRQTLSEMQRRMAGIPGVKGVALASNPVLEGAYGARPSVERAAGPRPVKAPEGYDGIVWFHVIGPAYFRVMGIPLLEGREFTEADTSLSPRVAMVNRAFVRWNFPHESPLGQRIGWQKDKKGRMEWMQIVGVVGDTRDFGMDVAPTPEFYEPAAQYPSGTGLASTLLVRTSVDPSTLTGAVREQAWSVAKEAPVWLISTDQIVAEQTAGQRFRAILLGSFGALGVLLAIVGIYGVISYAVSRRTREIGLRMALGAQPRDALRMVIGEGMILAIAGIALGIGGGLAATRVLRSVLFEIKPNDPATFVGVAIAFALAALAACYIPARRAMKVDPTTALRHE